jgi:hypothetical protein
MIERTDRPFARALAVLAEALVEGRRVLVVGDASLDLHELLTELGARVVHVYDPRLAERGGAGRSPAAAGARVAILPMPDGDFDVRDGAFDLAIVPDLPTISDPAALLARLRRVVGPEGAVICAAPHEEDGGLDYYALFDLVSLQFEHVRMIAAMPFFGVTMAELGQDEVDAAVRVDTQLAGDRPPPSAFLALASQSDVALDAYSVIELEAPPHPAAARADTAELAQAKLRAEVLEAQVQELAEARAARARGDEETRRAFEALEVERERAHRLERELDALASARAKAPAPAPRDEDLAEQLAQAQIRAAALEEGIELAERTIVTQRDRIADLEARLADAEEALATRPSEPPPEPPPEATGETEAEVTTLESKLRERGEKLAELETEVGRRDALVRELVSRLDEPTEKERDEALERKLDDLALLAARQKSELEARAWRIAELERRQPTDSAGPA